jgi:hypothetical protein
MGLVRWSAKGKQAGKWRRTEPVFGLLGGDRAPLDDPAWLIFWADRIKSYWTNEVLNAVDETIERYASQ